MGIFNINDKLTQYKINCREHIQRIDDNRLPKKFKLQTWREKKDRKATNEMGRWFQGGRNSPRGYVVKIYWNVDNDVDIYTLSLIVDDDDDDDENWRKLNNKCTN